MDGGDFNPFADEGIEMDPNAVPLDSSTSLIPPPPPPPTMPPSAGDSQTLGSVDIPSPDSTVDFSPFEEPAEKSNELSAELAVSDAVEIPQIPDSAEELSNSENINQPEFSTHESQTDSDGSAASTLIETPNIPLPDMDPPDELPQELLEPEPVTVVEDEPVIMAQMVDENQVDSNDILNIGDIPSFDEGSLESVVEIETDSDVPPVINEISSSSEALDLTSNMQSEDLPSFEDSEPIGVPDEVEDKVPDVISIEASSNESTQNEDQLDFESNDLNQEIDEEDLDLGSDLIGIEDELSLAMEQSETVSMTTVDSVDDTQNVTTRNPEESILENTTSDESGEAEFDFDDTEDLGEVEMDLGFGDEEPEAAAPEETAAEESEESGEAEFDFDDTEDHGEIEMDLGFGDEEPEAAATEDATAEESDESGESEFDFDDTEDHGEIEMDLGFGDEEPEAVASEDATAEESEESGESEFDFDNAEDLGEMEMDLGFGDEEPKPAVSEETTAEESKEVGEVEFDFDDMIEGSSDKKAVDSDNELLFDESHGNNNSESLNVEDHLTSDSVEGSMSEGVLYSTSMDDAFEDFGLNSEQDLSDFVEREGLVEDLELKAISDEAVLEGFSDEKPNDSSEETVWSTDVLEKPNVVEQTKEIPKEGFSILPQLLDQITDSNFTVDIDSINFTSQLNEDLAFNNSVNQTNSTTELGLEKPYTGSGSQASDVTWSSKEYQVGEWEILLNGNTSFEVLRKKISAFILDNRSKLSELMEYCEYCGLIDKNPSAIYVLSEIHKEIGERFATIGLKMEALMQLEALNTRNSDMLLICNELREFLPFEKELISKTLGLYRKLELEEERLRFIINIIKECSLANNLELARYYFDLCLKEGIESAEFFEIGMDLLEKEDRYLGLNEWIAKAISKYGDSSDWTFRQARSLVKVHRHTEALSLYKAYLSKTDEPIKVMEEIVETLKILGHTDQMVSYARQLLSMDPRNEIATSIMKFDSKSEVQGLELSSENSRNMNLESLELAIDRILEEKFKKFGTFTSKINDVDNVDSKSGIDRSVDMPDPFMDESLSIDNKKNILRHKLKAVEPKTYKRSDHKVLKSDFEITLQKARSLVSKETSQKDILNFLKESKQLIKQVDNTFDLNEELISLKFEATQLAKQIEDPMLGFFWINEFN